MIQEFFLKLTHLYNWERDKKWNSECPVCSAKIQLEEQYTEKIISN